MRSIRPVVTILAALALAGCASTTPGWTYAPAPSPTPIPSGSAEPSESAAPSGSAEPSGSPAPSGSGGGTTVELAAQDLAWVPTDLTVPPDEAFQLVFSNDDETIPHDVDIHESDPTGPKVFDSEPFSGVDTRTLEVDPLPAGIYAFVCSVHVDMIGTLTAE